MRSGDEDRQPQGQQEDEGSKPLGYRIEGLAGDHKLVKQRWLVEWVRALKSRLPPFQLERLQDPAAWASLEEAEQYLAQHQSLGQLHPQGTLGSGQLGEMLGLAASTMDPDYVAHHVQAALAKHEEEKTAFLERSLAREAEERASHQAAQPWVHAVDAFDASISAIVKIQRAYRSFKDRCQQQQEWPSDDNPKHWKHWVGFRARYGWADEELVDEDGQLRERTDGGHLYHWTRAQHRPGPRKLKSRMEAHAKYLESIGHLNTHQGHGRLLPVKSKEARKADKAFMDALRVQARAERLGELTVARVMRAEAREKRRLELERQAEALEGTAAASQVFDELEQLDAEEEEEEEEEEQGAGSQSLAQHWQSPAALQGADLGPHSPLEGPLPALHVLPLAAAASQLAPQAPAPQPQGQAEEEQGGPTPDSLTHPTASTLTLPLRLGLWGKAVTRSSSRAEGRARTPGVLQRSSTAQLELQLATAVEEVSSDAPARWVWSMQAAPPPDLPAPPPLTTDAVHPATQPQHWQQAGSNSRLGAAKLTQPTPWHPDPNPQPVDCSCRPAATAGAVSQQQPFRAHQAPPSTPSQPGPASAMATPSSAPPSDLHSVLCTSQGAAPLPPRSASRHEPQYRGASGWGVARPGNAVLSQEVSRASLGAAPAAKQPGSPGATR